MTLMPLVEHQDLIVPFLMDFMDISTLVSLGSTNKKNQEHLSEQVARRKSRFKAIQNKISNDLLPADNPVPSRETVHQALRLREEAFRLTDSGLGWVDHQIIMDEYDVTSACSLCSRDRLFADERKSFKAHRRGNITEDLLMLPTSFYISKNRGREDSSTDGTPPSEELVQRLMEAPLMHFWGFRDRTSEFFPDEIPLRTFTHPGARLYRELVELNDDEIVELFDESVQIGDWDLAFRIAARRFVKECPHSVPCLIVILAQVDRCAARGHIVSNIVSSLPYCEEDLWWSDEGREVVA